MSPTDLLDNPMWHALQGPHRDFARTRGRAARYDPEVTPFSGVPDDPDPADWADLAALLRPDEVAVLAGPALAFPDAWETIFRIAGVQMLGPDSPPPAADRESIGSALGPEDVEEMLELVARTRPGPFLPRTVELGGYLGVRRGGRLVAMAGHRMRLPGYTEVSAVCTDVEFRGQGIGGSLVDQVVAGILARGERPLLHATVENEGAIRLYRSLGFTLRKHIEFAEVRPPTG